jgi:hypothetical protein
VPVGGVAKEAIVAVNVTGFNANAGLGEAVSPSVGVTGLTVRVTVAVAVV